jgi:hypothetical protein
MENQDSKAKTSPTKISVEGNGYIFESYLSPWLAEKIITMVLEEQREYRMRRNGFQPNRG